MPRLARRLAPKGLVAFDGSLRQFGSYVNLKPQTDWGDGFHRTYRGVHSVTRDRVLLHLYDYSAGTGTDVERKARREHNALHRLQWYAWAPRILDSFQDAPGYASEMSFFTVLDPAAPSIAQRAEDESWTVSARLDFARSAVRALNELHAVVEDGEPMVHGNLSPATILVMHDNSPVLTGFGQAGTPGEVNPAHVEVAEGEGSGVVAQEVCEGALGVAGPQSDIYSLCASLRVLFSNLGEDSQASEAARVLATGMQGSPDARLPLARLDRQLTELLGESAPTPAAPPARFWTEGQIVPFRGREYRIVARLGSGGAGTCVQGG